MTNYGSDFEAMHARVPDYPVLLHFFPPFLVVIGITRFWAFHPALTIFFASLRPGIPRRPRPVPVPPNAPVVCRRVWGFDGSLRFDRPIAC